MSAPALFGPDRSRWFTIPAHRPFALDLARGLADALAPLGPTALADAVVLTPTRRAARALTEAFLEVSGGRALLPPQIRPLGDLDAGEPPFEPGDLAVDLPAAIDPLRRRFELVRLVKAHEGLIARDLTAAGALELADALGAFLDGLQIEEAKAEGALAGLVELELAAHWQVSRDFLEAAMQGWRERLAALGLMDVSERRVALLNRLAESWRRRPPKGVLVAAGSTGTAPATARVLAAAADAPQGLVVLPGLDQHLAEAAWRELDPQHPQFTMRSLLETAKVARSDVALWPGSPPEGSRGRWRARVVNEALRPAKATADWLKVIGELRAQAEAEAVDPVAAGLDGVGALSARTAEEAALACALLLREVLETPGRTAALVTPDAALARRVTARLARWGVTPDSSAGAPLAAAPAGVLAGLAARHAADPGDPVVLLAIAKHPLVRLGLAPEALSQRREALERWGLRGPRRGDLGGVVAHLTRERDRPDRRAPAAGLDEAEALAVALAEACAPLAAAFEGGEASVPEAARALAETLEALAAEGPSPWAGGAGEALARLLSALIHEAHGLPPATPAGFADVLTRLLADETLRMGGATHPQIRILGAIEARLVRADRMVLAGLEEGVWPQAPPTDPFLSRPMRARLELPSPERRVGLSAHDFVQAACAEEVVLVTAERRDGQPAVTSRWLWRLQTLAAGAGVELARRDDVVALARALDAPSTYLPVKRPRPCPPAAHRPRELAVTRVEALTRDPYSVWARDILKLYPLDRPDEPVEARARGTAIHAAFEQFARDWPRELPAGAEQVFAGLYLQALTAAGMPPEALARETALAREAAAWVVEQERARRADGRTIHVELKGELVLPGGFRLTAKADRIEISPGGVGHVLDYKTGRAPSKKMVETGFAPQLTLTGAILAAGGFSGLEVSGLGELVYLEVSGRRPAGRVEVRPEPGADAGAAAQAALEGLAALTAAFEDETRPYLSRTAPQFVKDRAGDYDHLARVLEWSTSGEGEE